MYKIPKNGKPSKTLAWTELGHKKELIRLVGSKIGILNIQGSKLSLQNSSNKEISKIDCKGSIFSDDILKAVMKTYFE